MELILIRHGLPVRMESVDGPADPGLAAEGVAQASALAGYLSHRAPVSTGTANAGPLEAIYTSPMLRARQTAAPLVEATGLDPVVLDGLAEWDRDASSYVPLEELQVEAPETFAELATAMLSGQWDVLGIDMEGFRRRVGDAMAYIVDANPGRRVAVVCHGGVINVYLAGVLGISRDLFFAPAYTGMSRVWASRKGHRGIVSVNETPHLASLAGQLPA